MRTPLILLAPLFLAGCVDASASYAGDGNALIVRAEQERFWSDQVTLHVIASRLPDCQRQLALGTLPLGELEIELFANGGDLYTLRAGERQWQVETQGCTRVAAPAPAASTEPLGAFRLDDRKQLVFEPAGATAAAE